MKGIIGLTPPVSAADIRQMLAGTEIGPRLSGMDDHTPFKEAGMDSLALFELVGVIQEFSELEIPDSDVEKISTIAGIVRYLNENLG
jgi:acyl carrier protein